MWGAILDNDSVSDESCKSRINHINICSALSEKLILAANGWKSDFQKVSAISILFELCKTGTGLPWQIWPKARLYIFISTFEGWKIISIE